MLAPEWNEWPRRKVKTDYDTNRPESIAGEGLKGREQRTAWKYMNKYILEHVQHACQAG
jgi:hypothetical protein